MDPTPEYWPLVILLVLLTASLGLLFLLRRQVNRESGNDEARTARALQSARKAAARLSRDRKPRRWARAQMQVVMQLAEAASRKRDSDNLGEVLAILDQVEPVLDSEGRRAEWATAVYYRGRTEWGLAVADTDGLEKAVETFRRLLRLKPWPRHLSHAIVMSLPAVILIDIGERKGDPAIMGEAIALCREAVGIARRRVVIEWSFAYRNLSLSLGILGRFTGDAALLEEAVTAGRKAASATRKTSHPKQWAAAHTCLGHALCTLGDLHGDADRLREGLVVLEEVRRSDVGRTMVAQTLGGALLAIGRLTRDRVALRRALQELIVALKVFDQLGRDFARAEAERMTGLALASLGVIEKDPAVRREAESHYRIALEIFTTTGASRKVTETRDALRALEDSSATDGPGGLNFMPYYVVR